LFFLLKKIMSLFQWLLFFWWFSEFILCLHLRCNASIKHWLWFLLWVCFSDDYFVNLMLVAFFFFF
jgi:hypothetical protein